ncbi:YVTN family beta-propeller protein [Sphaerotilus mobilis]|uniref:YVTN family beta-propeller protein n=1 Tax=Sphaerotilus mobilis TaxID=47994 RepID=A0A4Q7LE36_9BURK|nr:YVTN family beta-propeller protein [Sphaerotilus mobilis]
MAHSVTRGTRRARTCSVRAVLLAASLAGAASMGLPAVAAPFAYITNQGSHDVSVVDLASRRVIATLKVDKSPAGVVAASATARAYVGHPEAGTVSVIDMRSQRVLGRLAAGTAGGGPMGLDVTPDGRRVLAADWSRNRLLVLDPEAIDRPDAAPLRSIPTGRYPAGVLAHPDARRVFVAERDDDTVAVLDLDRGEVIARWPTGAHPFALMLDAARERLFVLNVYSDDLSVFDLKTSQPLARVAVGKAPYGAALTRDGRLIYVTNQRADSVSVIDAETLAPLRTLDGFAYPEGIAAHGDQVHVVNWMDDNLVVLDASSGRVLSTVPTGSNSRGFGRFIGQLPD